MTGTLLGVGDRLTSISTPGPVGTTYSAGKGCVLSIRVDQLPGPMGFYFVANIVFEDDRADIVIPLHAAAEFRVLNP